MPQSELTIPKHIAIIMDGNRRWAKSKSRPVLIGHDAGSKSLEKIVKHAAKREVEYVTVYAFSSENWDRDNSEIDGLKKLLDRFLTNNAKDLVKQGVRLKVIGDYKKFGEQISEKIENLINQSKENQGITLVVALSYGSRDEIIRAANQAVKDGNSQLNEETLSNYLDTKDIPDPDLVIRTSGEFRISNFLLWQAAYAEFYFSSKLWPDFAEEDLDRAILEYSNRERRYGA